MNILYITNTDPRSCSFGSEQRTNALWNSLKRYGSVYTLQISGNMVPPKNELDREHPIRYFIPQQYVNKPCLDFIFRHLWRLTKVPFLPFPYPLHKRIPEIFEGETFDLLVVRYLDLFAKYHLWKIAPSLVDIDDHPAQLFDTIVYHRLPYFIRSVVKLINRVQIRYVMSKMVGGWISNEEQLGICPPTIKFLTNMPVLPSVDYCPTEQDRKYLFTIGLQIYPPNSQGVNNFLKTIWPVFHRRYSDVQYLIGGKDAPQEMARQWNQIPGVRYVGFIENLEMAYQHCIATVVPVESGGGTCIKTLESLAYSRACLSTEFGARGFQTNGSNPDGLFVYSTADEFIAYFETLMNLDNRNNIEKRASAYIHNSNFKQRFEEAVDNVIKDLEVNSTNNISSIWKI